MIWFIFLLSDSHRPLDSLRLTLGKQDHFWAILLFLLVQILSLAVLSTDYELWHQFSFLDFEHFIPSLTTHHPVCLCFFIRMPSGPISSSVSFRLFLWAISSSPWTPHFTPQGSFFCVCSPSLPFPYTFFRSLPAFSCSSGLSSIYKLSSVFASLMPISSPKCVLFPSNRWIGWMSPPKQQRRRPPPMPPVYYVFLPLFPISSLSSHSFYSCNSQSPNPSVCIYLRQIFSSNHIGF